jgi:hypothetical protein
MNATGRLLLSTALLTALLNVPLSAQNADYQPIPAGFDFPAPEATLLGALAAGDEAKLRSHAWMVFAGLTQPARPGDPASEAIWETWYSGEEVFGAGPGPQGVRQLQRRFGRPRQFAPRPGTPQPQAVGESQLAFTLFNQETRDHTRQNKLHLFATMEAINQGWTAQTPVADRKVKDYPPGAMSLKTVWMLIKSQGMTPLPVWDEQPRVAAAPPQPPSTWKRVVLVDPSRDTIPPGETRDAMLLGKTFPASNVVPLSAFYHFALNAAQAAQVNASGAGVDGAAAGDFVVLVALHYTTKEIPNWVWATFWWHDKPNDGVFARDRPAGTIVKAPWHNYLMDVAYDMDLPKEADGTPNAAFNPWLEARFDNGVNSNCMTCHQRAVWSQQTPVPEFLPVTRGAAAPDDPIFRNGTKADFLWSLLLEGNQ